MTRSPQPATAPALPPARAPAATGRAGTAGPAGRAGPAAAPRRRTLLPLADGVALLAALLALNLVRFGEPTASSYPLREYLLAFVLYAALQVTVAYFAGLYEPPLRLGSRPVLPTAAGAAVVAALLAGVVQLMLGTYYVPRALLPAVPVLAAAALAVNRRIARLRRAAREGLPRVLLVGTPQQALLARRHLSAGRTRRAIVAGEASGVGALPAAVAAAGATDVLLLDGRLLAEVQPDVLRVLEQDGVGVLQRITARETLLGLRGVREVAGMPFVALHSHALPVSRVRGKRVLELAVVLLAAPLLLPSLTGLAVYVRLVAGRPVWYRQQRVGLDGVPFAIVKFRTMRTDAEEHGAVMASGGDERVVPACRWLRTTRLDELPQLVNVLRGQMSIVGPRPERPELAAHHARCIPGYTARHTIPPGMTGLAQIQGGYHTDPEYKLGHDLQYLVNWSPVLDLQILWRTVGVVLSRRG